MKWIKHQTATRRDERIARLIASHGMDGYGLYWAVQEIIAEKMEGSSPSCSVSYPVSIWANQLSTPPQQVLKRLSWLLQVGLIELSRSDQEIIITNTKLLKYRDEYSRKSGHAKEKVAPDTELDTEADTKTDKKPIARSVSPEELAGTLPLIGNREYQVSKSQIANWQKAFPGVNVKQELIKFKEWCEANPDKKKTERGIARAIFRWLDNAQNSHGGKTNGKPNRQEQMRRDVEELFGSEDDRASVN